MVGTWTGTKKKLLSFKFRLGKFAEFPTSRRISIEFLTPIPGWDPPTIDHPVATIDFEGVILLWDPATRRIVNLGVSEHSVGGACGAGEPARYDEATAQSGFTFPDLRAEHADLWVRSHPGDRVRFVSEHVWGCTRQVGSAYTFMLVEHADGTQEVLSGDFEQDSATLHKTPVIPPL